MAGEDIYSIKVIPEPIATEYEGRDLRMWALEQAVKVVARGQLSQTSMPHFADILVAYVRKGNI